MVTIYDGNIDLQMIFSLGSQAPYFVWLDFSLRPRFTFPQSIGKNTMLYTNQWEISRIQLMEVR